MCVQQSPCRPGHRPGCRHRGCAGRRWCWRPRSAAWRTPQRSSRSWSRCWSAQQSPLSHPCPILPPPASRRQKAPSKPCCIFKALAVQLEIGSIGKHRRQAFHGDQSALPFHEAQWQEFAFAVTCSWTASRSLRPAMVVSSPGTHRMTSCPTRRIWISTMAGCLKD